MTELVVGKTYSHSNMNGDAKTVIFIGDKIVVTKNYSGEEEVFSREFAAEFFKPLIIKRSVTRYINIYKNISEADGVIFGDIRLNRTPAGPGAVATGVPITIEWEEADE